MAATVAAARCGRTSDLTSLFARPPSAELDRRQLDARGDAELGVDLAQVVLDRPPAEEQPRGDLRVAQAVVDDELGDLELLRGEVVERARVALAGRLAGRAQLGPRALGPRLGPEPLELGHGGAQVLPRVR